MAASSSEVAPKKPIVRNDHVKRAATLKANRQKARQRDFAKAGVGDSYTKSARLATAIANHVEQQFEEQCNHINDKFVQQRENVRNDLESSLDRRIGPADDISGMTPVEVVAMKKIKYTQANKELQTAKQAKEKWVKQQKEKKKEEAQCKKAEKDRKKEEARCKKVQDNKQKAQTKQAAKATKKRPLPGTGPKTDNSTVEAAAVTGGYACTVRRKSSGIICARDFCFECNGTASCKRERQQ